MAWRVLWSPMQPSKCKACNLSGLRKSIVRWQQIGAFWNRCLEMSITTESLWLIKRRINITIHSFIYVLKIVEIFRKTKSQGGQYIVALHAACFELQTSVTLHLYTIDKFYANLGYSILTVRAKQTLIWKHIIVFLSSQ